MFEKISLVFLVLTGCEQSDAQRFCAAATQGLDVTWRWSKDEPKYTRCFNEASRASKTAAYKAAEPYRNIPR